MLPPVFLIVMVLISDPPVKRAEVMLVGVTPIIEGIVAKPCKLIDVIAWSGSFDEIESSPDLSPVVVGRKLIVISFFCLGASVKLVVVQENSELSKDKLEILIMIYCRLLWCY